MKQLTIISGKGGTGKTSITAAFASLTKDAVFADCDVDAADLHLILKPKIRKTMVFHGLKIPDRKKIAYLYSKGIPLVKESYEWREMFSLAFDKIKEELNK